MTFHSPKTQFGREEAVICFFFCLCTKFICWLFAQCANQTSCCLTLMEWKQLPTVESNEKGLYDIIFHFSSFFSPFWPIYHLELIIKLSLSIKAVCNSCWFFHARVLLPAYTRPSARAKNGFSKKEKLMTIIFVGC